jgi:uridine kinase
VCIVFHNAQVLLNRGVEEEKIFLLSITFQILLMPLLLSALVCKLKPQVLLNRGVEEEKIFLLSIIAAPEGVSRVCSRFPAVRVVTSEIDDHVDDKFAVVPGCGEFGDRYFCD